MTAQETSVADANLCCQALAALPSTGALFGKRSHWATGNEPRMKESLQPAKLGRERLLTCICQWIVNDNDNDNDNDIDIRLHNVPL